MSKWTRGMIPDRYEGKVVIVDLIPDKCVGQTAYGYQGDPVAVVVWPNYLRETFSGRQLPLDAVARWVEVPT